MATQLLGTLLMTLGTVLVLGAILMVGLVVARARSDPRTLRPLTSTLVNGLAFALGLAFLLPSSAFAGTITFTETGPGPSNIDTTLSADLTSRGSTFAPPNNAPEMVTVTLMPPTNYFPDGGDTTYGGNTILDGSGGVVATITEVPNFNADFDVNYFTVTFTAYPLSNGPMLGNNLEATGSLQTATSSYITWFTSSGNVTDTIQFVSLPELSSVPEPTSLVMAATSVLAGLGFAWRRWRHGARCPT
jgi:hypothetical protein